MATLDQLQILEFLLHPYLLTATTLMFSLYFFLIKKWLPKRSSNNKNLPPSPPRLPIFGNLHQLSILTHRSLRSLGAKYGPLMLLHFGSRPVIIVQSARAAREITKTHDLSFSDKPSSRTSSRLFYDKKGVTGAPYGEYWRKLKSVCVVHLLSSKRVQEFSFIRDKETSLLAGKIESCCSARSIVNLSELLTSFTNDVLCRAAFGRKYGDGEDGRKFLVLLREVLELSASHNVGDFIPCLKWVNYFNGFHSRVEKVAREMDDFLERVVREHLDSVEKDENRENFVDILLDVYKDHTLGVSIHRDSIKAVILDIFGGGTDTTAATLEWAMTELLRHPSAMKRLQTEIRDILTGKREITRDDLTKMEYLKAVIKETLRLHSPAPLTGREAREDVRVMGFDVKRGTMVILNPWAIGRDPNYWSEPEDFRPERFLSRSIDFKGLDFEFIPFGAGRRSCPGTAFATASIELVLVNLLWKFEWELPGGMKWDDLDVLEQPGVSVHRKNQLLAVARTFHV